EGTYAAYKTDIEQLIQAVFNKSVKRVTGQDFEKLQFDMLDIYFKGLYKERNKLGERVYKNNTSNRKISAAISLITRLIALGLIEADINYLFLIEPLQDHTEKIDHIPLEIAKMFISADGRELHKTKQKQTLLMLAVDS